MQENTNSNCAPTHIHLLQQIHKVLFDTRVTAESRVTILNAKGKYSPIDVPHLAN